MRRRRWLRFAAVIAVFAVGCGREPASIDLVDRFAFAKVGVERTRFDLGDPEIRPLLVRGWSLDERDDGHSFVWGVGEQSVIEFYLAEPRDLDIAVQGSPFTFPGAPPQTATFDLNGTPGPRMTLGPGMAEHRLHLPHAAARAGWNRLAIRYGYSRSPSETTGAPDSRPLAVAWDLIRFVPDGAERERPTADPAQRVLVLPTGTSAAYHLRLAAGSALRFDDVAFWGGPRTALTIRIESDAGESDVVARLDPTSAQRRIPLPDRAAGVVRIYLAADGAAAGGVRLTGPRVELPGGGEIARPGERRPTRRPNVLIYLVDTLRADRLGCYGHDRPTSPHLDRFARDAIRFTDAIAEAPWTRASVASLFTGLPPWKHRVNGRTDALPDAAVTLAELLNAAGYETAAFVTNGNIASVYGFAQGFEVFELLRDARIPGPDGVVLEPLPSSAELMGRVSTWLEHRDPSRPFLLYFHASDPHGPYLPTAEFRRRLGLPAQASELGSLAMLRALHEEKLAVDAELVSALLDLYDAEVAQSDEQFGQLLSSLRDRDLYDDTLVVFASDHGEEFYEHGGWEHGHTLHRELQHIPLLIKRPRGEDAGTEVDRTVQLGDVLPTVLDSIDGVERAELPGTSLLRPSTDSASRAAIAHLDLDGRAGDAVVEGRWKLVALAGTVRLFDRIADPGEQVDVSSAHPVTVDYLRERLAEQLASGPAALTPGVAIVTEEVRRNLEALGYIR